MSKDQVVWPFDLWLKTAVRGFGLSPIEFWAMSVRDWLSLLSNQTEQGLGRTEFSKLMGTYPDTSIKRDTND